jgi:tetratricopeptide (TPR) repeat protein
MPGALIAPGKININITNQIMRSRSMIKCLSVLLILFINIQVNAQSTDRILLEVGISRHEFGDYKGAIEAFTLALELNPQFALAYNNRGISKAMIGDDRELLKITTNRLRSMKTTSLHTLTEQLQNTIWEIITAPLRIMAG